MVAKTNLRKVLIILLIIGNFTMIYISLNQHRSINKIQYDISYWIEYHLSSSKNAITESQDNRDIIMSLLEIRIHMDSISELASINNAFTSSIKDNDKISQNEINAIEFFQSHADYSDGLINKYEKDKDYELREDYDDLVYDINLMIDGFRVFDLNKKEKSYRLEELNKVLTSIESNSKLKAFKE